MPLYRTSIVTPLGEMLALASSTGLCALEFDRRSRHERLDARLRRYFHDEPFVDEEMPILALTREWLSAYFAGTTGDAAHIPLDLRGAPFELRVWAALREIPAGATSTYGAIARQLGAPGASRAVGAANGANPVGIIVPCHRVIGSTGTLTGYGGGLERKQWLLNHEAHWRAQAALF
jgi:methylated-DNA-[protein]-cysteine S-methyltransferase